MPLFIICTECQHKNPADYDYCDLCGAELPDMVTRDTEPARRDDDAS